MVRSGRQTGRRRRHRGNALIRDTRGFLSWAPGLTVCARDSAGRGWPFPPDRCGFISMGCGFEVIKARNQSASLWTRRSQSLSREIAAGRIRRPWLPATPRSPLPSVLRVKGSLERCFGVCAAPPPGSPSGLHACGRPSLQAHARLVLSL